MRRHVATNDAYGFRSLLLLPQGQQWVRGEAAGHVLAMLTAPLLTVSGTVVVLLLPALRATRLLCRLVTTCACSTGRTPGSAAWL